MSTLCKCADWGGERRALWTKHHPHCFEYDPIADANELLIALMRGIEAWAADEDGVHPECWEAYRNTKLLLGEKVNEKQA